MSTLTSLGNSLPSWWEGLQAPGRPRDRNPGIAEFKPDEAEDRADRLRREQLEFETEVVNARRLLEAAKTKLELQLKTTNRYNSRLAERLTAEMQANLQLGSLLLLVVTAQRYRFVPQSLLDTIIVEQELPDAWGHHWNGVRDAIYTCIQEHYGRYPESDDEALETLRVPLVVAESGGDSSRVDGRRRRDLEL